MGNHAVSVLSHAGPSPALEFVDVFVKLIGKSFRPRSKLFPHEHLQIALERILRSDFFIAGYLINHNNTGLCQSARKDLSLLGFGKLLYLKGASLTRT
jgi:hypothetical protein